MIDLNSYESILFWGIIGIVFLSGVGLGYAWSSLKEEENSK